MIEEEITPAKVYRYNIPIDDCPHEFRLNGPILFVAHKPFSGGEVDGISFWAEYREEREERVHTFQVYGTGHYLPDARRYKGTALMDAENGFTVWHLYELFKEGS